MARKIFKAVTQFQCDACLTETTLEGEHPRATPEDWGFVGYSDVSVGFEAMELCGRCLEIYRRDFAAWRERRRPWGGRPGADISRADPADDEPAP
jgi:hypothetical protein